MKTSMEEDQQTAKYQNTLKVDVKNIAKNKTTTWRPIYEVIDTSFFEETNIFTQALLDLCENNPNKPQFL